MRGVEVNVQCFEFQCSSSLIQISQLVLFEDRYSFILKLPFMVFSLYLFFLKLLSNKFELY